MVYYYYNKIPHGGRQTQWYFNVSSASSRRDNNNAFIVKFFWTFLSPPYPLRLFFKNRALPLFLLYSSLTSCKKSEKTDDPILRSCVANEQTDGRRLRLFHIIFQSTAISFNLSLPTTYIKSILSRNIKNGTSIKNGNFSHSDLVK